MDSKNRVQLDQDEISLRELFEVLWRGKWLIFWVTVVFTLAAAVAAWWIPKSYKAQIVLSPMSNSSGSQLGALGSLASQFGGLASLAGVSVAGDSKKSESIAVLQSEALTEKYIEDNNLLPILYKDKWDATRKAWKESDPEKTPTPWKANEFFKNKVRLVTTETKTGLVTLTITWKDPRTAAKWANDLVGMTNDYLRNKAIEESERNIAYLNDQAARTNVVEARQAIYKILETEINKLMLARGSNEYAFKILDPAVAPERPANLPPLVWMVIGFIGGLLLSVPIVLIRTQSASSN